MKVERVWVVPAASTPLLQAELRIELSDAFGPIALLQRLPNDVTSLAGALHDAAGTLERYVHERQSAASRSAWTGRERRTKVVPWREAWLARDALEAQQIGRETTDAAIARERLEGVVDQPQNASEEGT